MMCCLTLNVFPYWFDLGLVYGKNSIAFLPGKLQPSAAKYLCPARRTYFGLFDDFTDRMVSGQKSEDMNVILRTSYFNCRRIVFVEDTSEIGMHPFLQIAVD
jgi:hypothetical protein